LFIADWILSGQNKELMKTLNFSFVIGEPQFTPKVIVATTKISESVLVTIPFVENHFS